MEKTRAILLFLGIVLAILIFASSTNSGDGIFSEIISAASEKQFEGEKAIMIKNIDSAIAGIDLEVRNLLFLKNEAEDNYEIDSQIFMLNTWKSALLNKKGEMANSFMEKWKRLKKEADSLVGDSATRIQLVENS